MPTQAGNNVALITEAFTWDFQICMGASRFGGSGDLGSQFDLRQASRGRDGHFISLVI